MKKLLFAILFFTTVKSYGQNIYDIPGAYSSTDTGRLRSQIIKPNIGTAPNKTAKFVQLVDARGVEMKIPVDSFSAGGAGYTNLTQFTGQSNWKTFYSDGSGDVIELSIGTSGQVLTSNGTSSAPSWQTPSSGSGTINSGTGFKIPFYDGTGTTLSQTSDLYYNNGSSNYFGMGTSNPLMKLDVTNGTQVTGSNSDNPNAANFTGSNQGLTSGGATCFFNSNSAMAQDAGGSFGLTGLRTTGSNTSVTTFATIKGAKENGTSGNFNGYFVVGVQDHNAGAIVERFRITSSGNVGIGTGSTVSAKTHIIGTTEQLRVGYDVSNYYSTTVSSTGAITLDAVGSGAEFNFSDKVKIAGDLELTSSGSGIKIPTGGAAATVGTATMISGTVTINTTSVCTSCKILIALENCSNCGFIYVSSRVSNTSFTVTSSNNSDASDVSWLIIKQ